MTEDTVSQMVVAWLVVAVVLGLAVLLRNHRGGVPAKLELDLLPTKNCVILLIRVRNQSTDPIRMVSVWVELPAGSAIAQYRDARSLDIMSVLEAQSVIHVDHVLGPRPVTGQHRRVEGQPSSGARFQLTLWLPTNFTGGVIRAGVALRAGAARGRPIMAYGSSILPTWTSPEPVHVYLGNPKDLDDPEATFEVADWSPGDPLPPTERPR